MFRRTTYESCSRGVFLQPLQVFFPECSQEPPPSLVPRVFPRTAYKPCSQDVPWNRLQDLFPGCSQELPASLVPRVFPERPGCSSELPTNLVPEVFFRTTFKFCSQGVPMNHLQALCPGCSLELPTSLDPGVFSRTALNSFRAFFLEPHTFSVLGLSLIHI